jgi:HAD superfamily hydrolase (TIGR01450 family)
MATCQVARAVVPGGSAARWKDDPMTKASTLVVDLDGVVWRGDVPIAGSSEAIARLRAAGARVAFFTNNSFVTTRELLDKLARQAIEASETDVLTSAQAAATLVRPGERVLVVGGPGCVEALEKRGARVVRAAGGRTGQGFDVVVVGLDPAFDYRRLAEAQAALLNGARLIGTNADATYPTPDGEVPGGGSILAAVATAGCREPVIAGKPYGPAVALVGDRLGRVDLVVGDRPSTDGAFALALGAGFGLVHTGITSERAAPNTVVPAFEADDLASLATIWIAARSTRQVDGDGAALA